MIGIIQTHQNSIEPIEAKKPGDGKSWSRGKSMALSIDAMMNTTRGSSPSERNETKHARRVLTAPA